MRENPGAGDGDDNIVQFPKTAEERRALRKAKELGYPHELWTTRLLARHAREHGPAEPWPEVRSAGWAASIRQSVQNGPQADPAQRPEN